MKRRKKNTPRVVARKRLRLETRRRRSKSTAHTRRRSGRTLSKSYIPKSYSPKVSRRRNSDDGQRFIRAYHIGSTKQIAIERPWRWALWEYQGGKPKRVGTAKTEDEAQKFLRGDARSLRRARPASRWLNPKKKKRAPRPVRSPSRRAALARILKKHHSRQNPDQLAEAARLSTRFHGRAPDRVIKIRELVDDEDFAKLGDLVKLVIGDKVEIRWDEGERPMLASDPNGRQLYVIGGDQDVRPQFRQLGVRGDKDYVDLGECTQVEYLTKKGFDKFEPIVYYHKLGEKGGTPPRLMFDCKKNRLYFVGGSYRVKPEGIVH